MVRKKKLPYEVIATSKIDIMGLRWDVEWLAQEVLVNKQDRFLVSMDLPNRLVRANIFYFEPRYLAWYILLQTMWTIITGVELNQDFGRFLQFMARYIVGNKLEEAEGICIPTEVYVWKAEHVDSRN